jgi:vancomycin resistance protein VanJ
MVRFLNVSLWVYVGALLIWCAVRALTGDHSVFVLALNHLGVWLFLPLLVFGPWLLLSRQKLGIALLVIPLALFLWFYGPMLVPRPAQAADPAVSLTVLTFNLQVTNTDVEALLAILDSSQAEVLALQEVTSLHEKHLSEALAQRYPYRWYYAPTGLAIYSAHPILSRKIYPAHPWPVQSAVIQVRDRPVHLLNAHLARAGILHFLSTLDVGQMRNFAAARAAQVAQIEDAIRETVLPAIVACDGNMTDLTSAYAQLTANLQDAFRGRGWGLGHTFLLPRGFEIRTPINLPVQRIDYLFHSPDIRVTEVQVITGDSGSDHRPLWAEFDLEPTNAARATNQP